MHTMKARDLFREIARGRLGVRRSRHAVRHDDQSLAHRCEYRSDQLQVTLAVNTCTSTTAACNLASLNLLKFLGPDDEFDVEGYKAAIEVVFTAQEILVGNADYPTEKIAETSRRPGQFGLGYTNLGALLMALGLPYDSDAGRAWAGALTALMTGHAYATSARTAARRGCSYYAGYTENAEHMLPRAAHAPGRGGEDRRGARASGHCSVPRGGRRDESVELAEQYGVRNSQASVLAPTSTRSSSSWTATRPASSPTSGS